MQKYSISEVGEDLKRGWKFAFKNGSLNFNYRFHGNAQDHILCLHPPSKERKGLFFNFLIHNYSKLKNLNVFQILSGLKFIIMEFHLQRFQIIVMKKLAVKLWNLVLILCSLTLIF